MRVLIDVHHPAHVHIFRPVRESLLARGHEVDVVAREKDLTLELLRAFDIPHEVLSRERGRARLPLELALRAARLSARCVRRRPDVMVGVAGLTIAHVGALLRIPTAVLQDTEVARVSVRTHLPFASVVVTPACWEGPSYGAKHLRYPGYHELAYLRDFRPDEEVLRASGVDPEKPYAVARFIKWGAAHDAGAPRLAEEERRRILETLAAHGPVFVSMEAGEVPPPGRPLPVPAEKVHHLLAFAGVVVGESPTMASEAAVLGVPAVYVDAFGRGYTRDQMRRFGHLREVPPRLDAVLAALDEAAALPRSERERRRARVLSETVDVAALLVEVLEHLPAGRAAAVEAGRRAIRKA